jgi:LmbE family N-acetylglucosaminyl deacetylase
VNILIISVHPDDETLGCGGTILKLKEKGHSVNCMFITDGNSQQSLIIEKVNRIYGFKAIYRMSLPETEIDQIKLNDIIGSMSKFIIKSNAEIIFAPNRSDVHSDHRTIFNALISSTKSFRAPFIKGIYMFETLSETEFAPALAENAFIPNTFVDITDYLDTKIEIMKIYETEIMPDPLPRSAHAIKGLAAFRGSRIGVKYAEAFMCIFQRF